MATAAMAAAASSRAFLRPHRHLLLPHTQPHRRRLSATPAAPASAPAAPAAASTGARRSVVDVLRERGLVEATTSEALASARPGELKVYCGFDPTAESLHLGNLLGLVVLSWFRRCGHTAVALVGGATGRVGDPSGKSAERPELDVAAVVANSDAIKSLVAQILGRAPEPSHHTQSGKNAALEQNEQPLPNSEADLSEKMGSFVILDNYDWWKEITLLDFLKEIGRFARVGTMIAKESVKKRLASEDGMSYTEFTYQLLQGYDFLYMFKNMGVNVQIGGSDQWGNITAGTELIRKILQVEGAHGLTFPLLLKSDGTKFGKSEEGAIWLSSNMLSPYKFYQHFFAVPDVDVIRFMKILTFLSLDEIQELEESMKKPGYMPNTVQRRLAEEVTRFVHGDEGLVEALKATEALRPGTQTQLDSQTIEGIADDVPSCSLAYDQVLKSPLVDLAVSTGLLASKSAVRRLIKQGGLYLNNMRIDSEDKLVEESDIVDGKVMLLSAGKKNKMVVRIL
ncbi:tyrosine--tRNA ligase, chloroplastic/mitochondrial-like [Phragmites australis]|uniref:tyrosine--tRNA ligase, chloroplastic/mitochondrial-like n=1 Tax=Phragmites australis TaxID=29695 RepID=UPI002D78E81C|nr:tyrosine--tRNA ligase, chloroplastic/mitochondrial-like [Phragmites australis]